MAKYLALLSLLILSVTASSQTQLPSQYWHRQVPTKTEGSSTSLPVAMGSSSAIPDASSASSATRQRASQASQTAIATGGGLGGSAVGQFTNIICNGVMLDVMETVAPKADDNSLGQQRHINFFAHDNDKEKTFKVYPADKSLKITGSTLGSVSGCSQEKGQWL